MTVVRTELFNTKESARRERFEPITGNSATNVQQAIANLVPAVPGSITLAPTVFSSLPAPNAGLGTIVFVTDSTVTTGNITVGGGAHKVFATSTGSFWVVMFDIT